jgi:hypothetical protein
MLPSIGSFMAFSETEAALQKFTMDATYKARLARGVKLELAKGTHPDDLKVAIRALLERRLSPGLLSRKVEDIHKPRVPASPIADPYQDFPEY